MDMTDNREKLQKEFRKAGANIVRELFNTYYHNKELVIENIDGRWIGFGIRYFLNTSKSSIFLNIYC